MDLSFTHPYFLGPKAENQEFLESFLLEFLRDHAYWRKNLHPQDGHAIPTSAIFKENFADFQAEMRKELRELSGELKNAAPFFSPRYIGHMNADLLLPGLIALFMTTMYNPNNIASEAGPATVSRELDVGFQLAEMFGFNTNPDLEPCAWGHLTSGGTVANYEAVWNFREVKYYPLSVSEAAKTCGLDFHNVGPYHKDLSQYTAWELMNFSIEDTINLRSDMAAELRDRKVKAHNIDRLYQEIKKESFLSLGAIDFFQKHADINPPCLVVPITAHYSWEKAMKVLGFGTKQLMLVHTDDCMRMRKDHLDEVLEDLYRRKVPILGVVGVLGSTEFSSVDPLNHIVVRREEWKHRGLYFGIHVDGAWGGYMASMFRRTDGSFCEREEVASNFKSFPSEALYDAFDALSDVDSVTIDPHKLGYLPYPSGAFVCRDVRVTDFIGQQAAYLYDLKDELKPKSVKDRLKNLGQFILEGSKPGAAAAAAYVTHRVLPLHKYGFGKLVEITIKSCEYFFKCIKKLNQKLSKHVEIRVPFEPETNIICFAINPKGNPSLALMNYFGRQIFENIKINPAKPMQLKEFIGSYTSLRKGIVDDDLARNVLEQMGIDPATFTTKMEDTQKQSDHIFLFRHSLMSPWLLHKFGEMNVIDHYCQYLERLILEELQYET
jgi:glutamate/tyrosine decarboxylase-like PLP-dependent enzyme